MINLKFFSLIFLALFFGASNAVAFDLKSIGDSLNKDLGGALKELEKGLNSNNQTENSNNQTEIVQEPSRGDATANIVNGLCVVTYIASDGSEHIRQSTAQDCEQNKRYFLLNDAPTIENNIE